MGKKQVFDDEYHRVQREKMQESRKKRTIELLEQKIVELDQRTFGDRIVGGIILKGKSEEKIE